MDNKSAPILDRALLVELSHGRLLRQAEQLFETYAVELAEWKYPVLRGKVNERNGIFRPELNLRSTVFVKSICNCPDGRKRKVCVHALAVALHYEARRKEACNAESATLMREAFSGPETTPDPKESGLRSIRLAEDGEPLRLLIFLPPNLDSAANSGEIAVKIDAALGRSIVPINQLRFGQKYKLESGQAVALKLVESWCGGKLAGLLQLTGAQLRELLDAVINQPVVYRVKKPNVPIDWVGNELPDVHRFLSPSNKRLKASDAVPHESPDIHLRPNLRLSEPSKPNPRRIAESKRPKLWKSEKGDFPAASMVANSMSRYSEDRLVVDGSTNYIAVRLPLGSPDLVQPLRSILKGEGFMLEPGNRKWWLRGCHKVLNFLAGRWKPLKEVWQAEFTENFQSKLERVEFSKLSIEVKESTEGFMLDLRLDQRVDPMEMRRALNSGQNYVEAEDGTIVLLEPDSVERFHEIERAVSGRADHPFSPTFSHCLHTQELPDVEGLLKEISEGWQPPKTWSSRSRALREVDALEPAPVRAEFNGILRPYQRVGAAWLWHLYRHQLGGILADEMGLGKTLQALALIECIKNRKGSFRPALVVCPASLIENWLRESNRFTSQIRAVKHHGNKRAKESVVLEGYDLVITSYGTLRQDADLFKMMSWSVVVGDEAQHIKNPRSLNAGTLSSLRSEGRVLLTGTPVENSLDDLTALFQFLMPGYLQRASGKLTQEDKARHNNRQIKRAAAYILRRSKKQVVPELPDKIEKTFFCEFGPKQQRFYRDTLEKTRREIFNLEMSGANAGRVQFAAFTELLRLRQVCVDPRILDEKFPETDSAKLSAFDEILDECLDANSRLLVFSSFTGALKLLAEHLKKKGYRFCYLDGQTKNRLRLVDQFNEDTGIPVFLISLKAGGSGLNLTGADTVLHYDPWWNPAVEAQATDRAHRIGQSKVVTSIKLIAANTVEEKVLELQARKSGIIKKLFDESEAVNAKMSPEDIKSLLE